MPPDILWPADRETDDDVFSVVRKIFIKPGQINGIEACVPPIFEMHDSDLKTVKLEIIRHAANVETDVSVKYSHNFGCKKGWTR